MYTNRQLKLPYRIYSHNAAMLSVCSQKALVASRQSSRSCPGQGHAYIVSSLATTRLNHGCFRCCCQSFLPQPSTLVATASGTIASRTFLKKIHRSYLPRLQSISYHPPSTDSSRTCLAVHPSVVPSLDYQNVAPSQLESYSRTCREASSLLPQCSSWVAPASLKDH